MAQACDPAAAETEARKPWSLLSGKPSEIGDFQVKVRKFALQEKSEE